MDKATFEAADPILNEISDAVTKLLDSPEVQNLRDLLTKLSTAVGDRYGITLDVNVHVFNHKREAAIPLLQTGLAGFERGEVYQHYADSSPQRYTVEGEMQVVPHDRCPKCWEVWDFKFKHPTCGHCGAAMGKNVKLLIDNDVCPWCEKGNISMSKPVCDKCGHEVDPKTVVWG
jgi:hypothetical protein